MKTVYIVRCSQLTESNVAEYIKDFSELTGIRMSKIAEIAHQQGGSQLHLYKEEEMEQVLKGAIYLFKTGQITEEMFVEKMNQAINSDLSLEDFKACWNAMCYLKPATVNFLREIVSLQQNYGFGIHVMMNSNKMHFNYINQQFKEHGIALETSNTLSFEIGSLELAPPKSTDPSFNDCRLVDLRNTHNILAEINKISANSLQVKPKPRP